MDISQGTGSCPQTAAGKLFREQNATLAELAAEEEALLEPILARLSAIRAERMRVRERFTDNIGEALQATTFEDLTDPFRAIEFFEAYWNSGRGVANGHQLYRSLFAGTYFFDVYSIDYGSDGLIYLTPQLAIPSSKDEPKLALTAEKVGAVHRANIEIVGSALDPRIPIFDDSYFGDSAFITFDQSTDEWVLETRYGTEMSRSEDLVEVLRAAPTYQ